MNTAWHTFLSQQGARINESRVTDFGEPTEEAAAALSGDVLCDLGHLALIQASGADVRDFLQGQLTNDIRQVDEQHHQLSGYCTPKGRLLALFRLFQRGENHYLRLPHALLEPTLKRLRMFVMRSQVVMAHDQTLIGFGISGPNSETLLQTRLGAVPEQADAALQQQGITILRIAGPQPRFELYGNHEAMQALWLALADNCRPVGAAGWELLDIHAGLPTVLPETSEAFVPQMLNLQYINGVNFKKGCYTGQEVVARMQYLGKLKRRMYLARLESVTAPPSAGDELASPQSSSGQGAGKIVQAALVNNGTYDLLVVAETNVADSGELYLATDKQQLKLLPLPYGLEETIQQA